MIGIIKHRGYGSIYALTKHGGSPENYNILKIAEVNSRKDLAQFLREENYNKFKPIIPGVFL